MARTYFLEARLKGSGAPMKAKTGKKNEEKDVVKYTMICNVKFDKYQKQLSCEAHFKHLSYKLRFSQP